MDKPIDRLVDSVGVATFIKYFNQFSDLKKGRLTKSKMSELFGENSEPWTDGSITTKINAGLKIFTLNRELEAIDHILFVKKTRNIPNGKEIKKMASEIKELLIQKSFTSSETDFNPTELTDELTEGNFKTVQVNLYERNPKARLECIKHFGLSCQVCEFDFEKTFGAIGKGFIHVHHLNEFSILGKEYVINPKTDLVPVCPNCHSMLHKKKPAFTISELKQILRKKY
ncbi:HNH endonuclease [Flavobacterium sp. ASW18X]|uniref:HNH endonuclease n=1 Tax=Flavobacterium sp. ASW18X TaxID=2572595 RepID=UPI0010AEB783|nr:HNH endonuclease [Flavobacterium sp. ASW18X]TKD60514.1 hypothetical protein FBT53_12985 [Flavobacterium sp. ASW18X]